MKQRLSCRWLYFSAMIFFLVVSDSDYTVSSFVPKDSILLNCGSSSDSKDDDSRQWTGDANSKFSPENSANSFAAQAASQDQSLPSTVPYMTARILTSNSSYMFPLSSGRHFVRLYFYPSSYNNLNINNAVFSVSTGDYTLLNNFNVSQNALALTQAYFIKEFYIFVSTSNSLSLTFTPSISNSNCFAYVNGIEIVSTPELFASAPPLVGFTSTYPISNSTAAQTIIRLNVGGQYISPSKDLNLSRIWYDDTQYIFAAGRGVSYSADSNVSVQYNSGVQDYVAPSDVYLTARSMGPSVAVNLNYNLTWLLTVDGGFYYYIRLHFCEIQSEIFKPNQRAFSIFVQNSTAFSGMDVIQTAQLTKAGLATYDGFPVIKDFVVLVPYVAGGQADFWLQLTPDMTSHPQIADAILNGIELFKLSNNSGNLAGENPAIPPTPPPAPTGNLQSKRGGVSSAVLGGTLGAVAVVLVGLLVCFVVRRKQRKAGKGSENGPSGWLPLSLYSGKSTTMTTSSTSSGKTGATGSYASSLPSNLCRHFTIAEIIAATNNFDDSLLLGVGGFGKVYKGDIDNGTKVAIKRANPLSEQGVHEFQTEIEMLSKLRHRHLVSLIGYCEDNCEMILVYDYMSHGTLREHLYKTNKPPLSWKQRLEISIGAARGLHYLHTGAKHTIIHRDVKTTNILLDEKWVAKVSDFGLSKTGPALDRTHVSTVVKGSFGYLDPEYYRRQQLTEKSDVYSFGVVLFEVLCARPALNPTLPKEQVSLAEWGVHCQKKGILEQILDPYLRGKIAPECFRKFAETAEKCVAEEGIDRPSMGDVLWNLEFALQLQESAEDGGKVGFNKGFVGGDISTTTDEEMQLSGVGMKDSDGFDGFTDTQTSGMSLGGRSLASVDSDGMTPSAVFSQLVNPKGR